MKRRKRSKGAKARSRSRLGRSLLPAGPLGVLGFALILLTIYGLSELGRWMSGSTDDWQNLRTGTLAAASMTIFTIGSYYGIRGYRQMVRLRAIRLSDVDRMTGTNFENYVAKLLSQQGYRVQPLGGSGDQGVDLIAIGDTERIAIQVKRYREPLSRRAVSDAVAGRIHYGCTSAMVVTNSRFTPGAKQLADSTGCRLVGREELIDWIVAFRGREAA